MAGTHTGNAQERVIDWLYQTVEELSQGIPIEEQMIVSILAAAWRSERNVWDSVTLKSLLESFARDTNTAAEYRLDGAMQSIDAGASVVEALASSRAIGAFTSDALRIAIEKRQLDEFFICWRSRPLRAGVLIPFEQTLMSKLLRFVVTCLVMLNVLVFVMLFIIPEFQKMFQEFGIEMTATTQMLMVGSDVLVSFWFIPFFLMLVLGFFFLRGSNFGGWWRRWSSRSWTAIDWHKSDRKRLVTAWKLRPAGVDVAIPHLDASSSPEAPPKMKDRWDRDDSLTSVLTKSESAALSLTDDKELKDWLLEKMISSKRNRRTRTRNVWATIFLGAGHCFLGVVVLLLAISVFGSLLEIVYGLAGGRP